MSPNLVSAPLTQVQPVQWPRFSPFEARLWNALSVVDWPLALPIGSAQVNLGIDRALQSMVSANYLLRGSGAASAEADSKQGFELYLSVGKEVWMVEIASLQLLGLHPLLAEIAQSEDAQSRLEALPWALRQAVLEALFGSVVEKISAWLHVPLAFVDKAHAPERLATEFATALPLCLQVPTPEAVSAVPCVVRVPSIAAIELLLGQLEGQSHQPELRDDLPVSVRVEAGRMRVPVALLRELAVDDVLLPPAYPAQEGKIFLRMGSGHGTLQKTLLCTLHQGQAVIRGAVSEEYAMSQSQEPGMEAVPTEGAPTESAPAEATANAEVENLGLAPVTVDVNALEVNVHFELERQVMTVADVSALAAGYTFALASDPLAPVTLRVNDTAVAQGRVVDLGGTLGVQITKVFASGAPQA